MSATVQDAMNGAQGALRSLDVAPAAPPDAPDFTEELADEVTSELGSSPRAERPAVAAAPPPPVTAPAARGDGGEVILRDRYLLETQIGNGGAATVHRAVDLRRDPAAGEGRHVAIKLLRPELRERPHSVARLQREFRQTQAVAHPNVVRFLDLDRDGDAWFIVMELLSGETLGPLLRRSAPCGLPVPEALRIALAVGDALAHAHAHGVTHGDVKPDNVFLTGAGQVRLIDFGVAPDAGPWPNAGVPESPVPAAATRVYASPEVLAGEAPEPRDDVFSLACVIHEMIAGRHPYGRRGVDRSRDAAVAPERLASLGAARATAVSAALSLARAGRPSMAELLRELRADDAAAAARAAAAAPVQQAPAKASAPAVTTPPPARSRLAMLATVAAALALLLGILIGRLGGEPQAALAPARIPQPAEAQPKPEPQLPAPPTVLASSPAGLPGDAAAADEPAVQPPQAGPPGLVFFDAPRMVVSRRSVVAPVPLRHLNHARRAVSVNWRAIDGSARSGRDFAGPQSGIEHFVEGNSFRILYVPLIPSATATRDRSFTIELTEVSQGAELGPTATVEITILGES